MIVRFPVIPGCNDDEENLAAMAELLKKLSLSRIDLLPYNPAAGARYRWLETSYSLEGLRPPTPERLEELASRLL